MLISALPAWLPGARPARATTLAILRRSSGMSAGLALYAVEVKRPRKRCSPQTLPSSSKRLTRDVVEIAGAMHGRARRRLGDDQKLRPPRVRLDLGRQRGEAGRDVPCSRPSRRMPRLEPGTICSASSPPIDDELVAAVAEEGEVIVGEPRQEGPALGELVGRQRRWPLLVLREYRADACHASSSSPRPPRARRPARGRCRRRARRALPDRRCGRPRRG